MPTITPAGPIFGPDALTLDIDGGNPLTTVNIYPDAHNVGLREAGQPSRFYLQSTDAVVAQRQQRDHLDFSMTALVKRVPAVGPADYAGGTCTLTTILAFQRASTEVIVDTLVSRRYDDPADRMLPLFACSAGDPRPELLPMPILRTSVSCTFSRHADGGDERGFSVQASSSGSIEPQGRTTLLLTCGSRETADIASSLRDGTIVPLVVDYLVAEQFSTGGSELTVDIELDADGRRPRVTVAAADDTPMDDVLSLWISNCDQVRSAVSDLMTGGTGDSEISIASGSAQLIEQKPTRTRLQLSGSISVDRTVGCSFAALADAARVSTAGYLTEINVGSG